MVCVLLHFDDGSIGQNMHGSELCLARRHEHVCTYARVAQRPCAERWECAHATVGDSRTDEWRRRAAHIRLSTCSVAQIVVAACVGIVIIVAHVASPGAQIPGEFLRVGIWESRAHGMYPRKRVVVAPMPLPSPSPSPSGPSVLSRRSLPVPETKSASSEGPPIDQSGQPHLTSGI